MWVDAVEGSSDFQPYEVSWEKVPGRNDKWRAQTISNMGGDAERFDIGNPYNNQLINIVCMKSHYQCTNILWELMLHVV